MEKEEKYMCKFIRALFITCFAVGCGSGCGASQSQGNASASAAAFIADFTEKFAASKSGPMSQLFPQRLQFFGTSSRDLLETQKDVDGYFADAFSDMPTSNMPRTAEFPFEDVLEVPSGAKVVFVATLDQFTQPKGGQLATSEGRITAALVDGVPWQFQRCARPAQTSASVSAAPAQAPSATGDAATASAKAFVANFKTKFAASQSGPMAQLFPQRLQFFGTNSRDLLETQKDVDGYFSIAFADMPTSDMPRTADFPFEDVLEVPSGTQVVLVATLDQFTQPKGGQLATSEGRITAALVDGVPWQFQRCARPAAPNN